MDDPFAHPSVCRDANVTRLAEPTNSHAVHTIIEQELAAGPTDLTLRGPVLLSLDLSETGEIVAAAAIDPPATPGVEVIAILIDAEGRRTLAPPSTPAPSARKALALRAVEVLGFRPAERAGVPVAFPAYRMTLHVGQSGRAPAA